MTADRFKEIMLCNEPDSVCNPNGKYYVTASDSPGDLDLEFETLDEMLDHWMIQGKTLREILPDIDLE